MGREKFKPRYVDGELLGAEWDEALGRYWRERDHVEEMRRVETVLQGMGRRPLAWLEEQEGSGRALYSDEEDGVDDEDEDADGETDDEYVDGSAEKRVEVTGKARRDSGGSEEA